MKESIWGEAVVSAFKSYCDLKTFSYSEIAARLTTQFGISFTRNACIGKAGRLGIVAPHSNQHPLAPAKRAVAKVRVRTRKPRMVKTGFANFAMRKQESAEYKLRAIEIVCETSFEDVTGCRYPVGDGPFLFCNGKQQEGSSFCTAHHALCWVAPRSRRDQARAA